MNQGLSLDGFGGGLTDLTLGNSNLLPTGSSPRSYSASVDRHVTGINSKNPDGLGPAQCYSLRPVRWRSGISAALTRRRVMGSKGYPTEFKLMFGWTGPG